MPRPTRRLRPLLIKLVLVLAPVASCRLIGCGTQPALLTHESVTGIYFAETFKYSPDVPMKERERLELKDDGTFHLYCLPKIPYPSVSGEWRVVTFKEPDASYIHFANKEGLDTDCWLKLPDATFGVADRNSLSLAIDADMGDWFVKRNAKH